MASDPRDLPKLVAVGTRPRGKLELHRLDRLPARPHREEIVGGLIAAGELVALVGRPGVGKTALLARLAVDIAEGRPFLGRVVSQGAVCYVAAEKGEELKRRLLAIRRKASAPIYLTTSRPNLAAPIDVDGLCEEIEKVCEFERKCPALVILDTLARVMPGLNEDRASDASRIVEAMTLIAERVPTAAVLIAHHVAKASGTIRGSSALLGGLDLVLRVERGKGVAGRIVVEKANAVDEGQALGFRLAAVEYREAPDCAPEPVISVETPRQISDDPPAVRAGRLSPRAKTLLTIIERDAPMRRLDALDVGRKEGLFEGTANATRMACTRCLEELVGAALILIDAGDVITVSHGPTSDVA
ncbi:MAG TPA: AAA family ATPase [Hyphomicrobium sp.]|nr:AAA family ATPase [Hyphomicrobium sp.]